MTKDELKTRLEAAEKQNLGLLDEIKNLKEKLAEMQDEPEIPEYPFFKHGEKSTLVRFFTPSNESTCENPDGFNSDYYLFHTKDYAQEYADKCKLIAMMLHCKWYIDRDFVPDFGNFDDNFTVWYDHADNEWTIDSQEIHEMSSIYFSTEEAAKKCAEWLNEHWKENGND